MDLTVGPADVDLVVVVTVVMTERVDERVLDVTTERVEVADAVRVSYEREREYGTGDIRVVVGTATAQASLSFMTIDDERLARHYIKTGEV